MRDGMKKQYGIFSYSQYYNWLHVLYLQVLCSGRCENLQPGHVEDGHCREREGTRGNLHS